MALHLNDQRRAALSAGLLASDHDGEVVAAARALVCLLKKGDLDPAAVVTAGLESVAAPPLPAPKRYPCGYPRPMRDRAWMARSSPNLNDWERGFLNDIIRCSSLSPRQEDMLRKIVRKSEGERS